MADPPPPAIGADAIGADATAAGASSDHAYRADTAERASAGAPADLARLLIHNPAHTVLLRVAGASMQGAGIQHGDLVVVDCRRRARAGQVVVALVEGGFTLKRLAWRDGHWWLDAAHPAYPALALGDGRIWGVAVHAIRALHGIGARRR